jgi:hypothetical protein
MKMTLRVTSNGGKTEDVVASAAELVAFEAEFSRSVAKLQDEFKYTDICWLAWHSAKRNKKTTKDFIDWVDGIESVEIGSEEAEPIPLETPAPAGQ